MKKIRITLLIFIILINSIIATGCWNYREVDKLSIVAGAAIDKGTNGGYKVTVEIVQISGGKETKTKSKFISMEGKTLFDAVRNGIAITGKKLYWPHTKVLIVSKEIASEGLIKVIDWYNRDSETREDVHILISTAESAQEIFSGQGETGEIKSFVLDEVLSNQESLSKTPIVDIMQFDTDLKAKGKSPIASVVNLKQVDGKMVPQVMGTAIFKKDKLVGFLSGEETKDLLFIKDKLKRGLLIEKVQVNDVSTPVSLEIFKSKTDVTPVVNGQDIQINLNINATVAIDEIQSTENILDDKGIMKLEKSTEKVLAERIEALIKKIQSDYALDIFGFGAVLREDKPKVWKSVSGNWEEIFQNLNVNVITKVQIKNSAILAKPLEEGD